MGPGYFRLPGGKVRRGDDEVETLKRKMTKHLAPDNPALRVQWDVGEVLGCFHRPNFDTAFYPYVPPHITRPKESRKLFVVQLPERCVFAVPKNAKLVAVPLFDLYDNLPRYGPIISALPLLLSRLRLNLQFVLPPPPPQAPAMQGQGQTAAQQQGFQGQGHENGAGGGMAIQPYEGHYA
ncbi:hypothetical protein HYH03_013614 [Edaphochlamys debaryana]|uniref:Cleavage and polyadenylation specificity factor subunit 5 n=1 Tax=Edaphochlamys debaryana TaxID=47281 RepID=A0A835XQD2_9CHLO|nr:hypothetical protein HYH03_013614 [Edaphochlamys debaryana]|eukprot:KAG2487769.1 hypothetical protein HYH03_013614 [Edaphochlamys debaryana]